MWSRKRKRIAKKYNHWRHRLFVFWNFLQRESAKKLSRAMELSALYGVEKGAQMMREQENGLLIAVPDNLLKQIVIKPLER